MSGNLNDINQFSTIDANNTNIEGIDTASGWSPSNVGPAFRALMGRLARVCQGLAPWNQVLISGAAATVRPFQLQTGGVARWQIDANATAETGSNAGSDFELWSYTDAGAQLTKVMSITRSTGVTTFTGAVTLGSNSITGSDFVITGGSINATTVGATTPAAGTFTTLTVTTSLGLSTPLAIASGGTGQTTAAAALTALGGAPVAGNAAQTFAVANAAAANEAMALGQAQAAFAALAGLATQAFSVANATATTEAVALAQSLAGAVIRDVTPSRAANVVYTNSTPRAMFVSIRGTAPAAGNGFYFEVGAFAVNQSEGYGAGAYIFNCGLVPPGATYQLVNAIGVPTMTQWTEVS